MIKVLAHFIFKKKIKVGTIRFEKSKSKENCIFIEA